jgi:hypothetical protein
MAFNGLPQGIIFMLRKIITVITTVLTISLPACVWSQPAERLILQFFGSAACGVCREIKEEILLPAQAAHPDRIDLRLYDVDTDSGFALLHLLEKAYGVRYPESITLFFPDTVLTGSEDIQRHAARLIARCLARPETISARPDSRPDLGLGSITWHGSQRMRWSFVESDSAAARGPFGEELPRGKRFLYHMDLELAVQLSTCLEAGGLLRLSNEGDAVLEGGPQYLSHGTGSVFARYKYRLAMVTAGYYDIHFTPLTLMRWDTDDLPPQGGEIACGACGGGSDRFGAQNLEPMGPDLTFEGLHVKGEPLYQLRYTAFYAIPQWTRQVTLAYQQPDFRFQRSVWGGMLDLRHPVALLSGPVVLQFTGLRLEDDPRDPTPPAFAVCTPHTENCCALDNTIFGTALTIPAGPWVSLQAEALQSQTRRRAADTIVTALQKGYGLSGTVVFDMQSGKGRRLRLSAGYQSLDSSYTAPYSALSYIPNREGMRLAAAAQLHRLAVTLFYKSLREKKRTYYDHTMKNNLYSTWAEYALPWSITVGAGYLQNAKKASGAVRGIDEKTATLSAEARYAFSGKNYLSVTYQNVLSRDRWADQDAVRADMAQVLTVIHF